MTSVICITGPTASGKSAVADLLAQQLDTEVISADAMQVYRGMDIGTAKVPLHERKAPLLLVDIADAREPYSAALYQRDARSEIDRLLAQDRVPILCGGTGLYIRAAVDEMRFPSGEVDDGRRKHYQQLADELGPQGIHALLGRLDPEAAAVIHPNNTRRVIRALEMHDEGVSYAVQKAGFSRPVPAYPSLHFALTLDRSKLYARIDSRVDAMMDAGLVDEVKRLVAEGARDAITSRQAIGYKEIIDALDGRCTMAEAVDLIKRRSRRYAKRQLAWCRRDPRMQWIDMDAHGAEGAAAIIRAASEGR